MNPPGLFAELRRRNVYKVAVAYAIVGWLLIQVATATFPVLEQAYEEGAGADLFLLKVDPMLDDLRGDQRFEALVGKILAPKS